MFAQHGTNTDSRSSCGETKPLRTRLPIDGRPGDIAGAIERYRELGAPHFVFDVLPEKLSVALDTMERFAEEVRPLLA